MQLSRILRMVVRHHAKSWDEFVELAGSLEGKGELIHVFFKGDKDEKGESWCPYCVKAAPVVEEALKLAPENSHFITVVIDRPFWKDLNNPYRKDPRTNLVFLPTLLRWKSPQRLDGERVSSADLVEMLLSDDE